MYLQYSHNEILIWSILAQCCNICKSAPRHCIYSQIKLTTDLNFAVTNNPQRQNYSNQRLDYVGMSKRVTVFDLVVTKNEDITRTDFLMLKYEVSENT